MWQIHVNMFDLFVLRILRFCILWLSEERCSSFGYPLKLLFIMSLLDTFVDLGDLGEVSEAAEDLPTPDIMSHSVRTGRINDLISSNSELGRFPMGQNAFQRTSRFHLDIYQCP